LGKLHENEDILICAPFSRGDSVNPVTILECLATIGATPQELVRPGATMRRVGSLELDLIERTARGERPIELLPREYRLLDYMMQRSNELLTRARLFKEVWNYRFVPLYKSRGRPYGPITS
jgi:DNA-binding response OmpR family regulator